MLALASETIKHQACSFDLLFYTKLPISANDVLACVVSCRMRPQTSTCALTVAAATVLMLLCGALFCKPFWQCCTMLKRIPLACSSIQTQWDASWLQSLAKETNTRAQRQSTCLFGLAWRVCFGNRQLNGEWIGCQRIASLLLQPQQYLLCWLVCGRSCEPHWWRYIAKESRTRECHLRRKYAWRHNIS